MVVEDPSRACQLRADPRFGDIASAAVAGATGGCGRAVVERLVAEGVPVRALVRDYTKAVCAAVPRSWLPPSGTATAVWGKRLVPHIE